MQISNAQPEWMKFMADLETEEPEPRARAFRNELQKEAAQLAIYPELVAALEKANQRCFDLGHGCFETDCVLERAKVLL